MVHENRKEATHEKEESKNEIKCYVCDQKFKTRNGMMRHRKQQHTKGLRICRDYEKGTCEFGADRCWYMHSNGVETQDFCSDPENQEPPEKQ